MQMAPARPPRLRVWRERPRVLCRLARAAQRDWSGLPAGRQLGWLADLRYYCYQ